MSKPAGAKPAEVGHTPRRFAYGDTSARVTKPRAPRATDGTGGDAPLRRPREDGAPAGKPAGKFGGKPKGPPPPKGKANSKKNRARAVASKTGPKPGGPKKR